MEDNKVDEDKRFWTEQDQQAALLAPPLAWEFISALSTICQGVIEMPKVMQLPEGMTQALLGDKHSRQARGIWRGETCLPTENRTPSSVLVIGHWGTDMTTPLDDGNWRRHTIPAGRPICYPARFWRT
eukprot:485318-Hanusia_phi.AAC.1